MWISILFNLEESQRSYFFGPNSFLLNFHLCFLEHSEHVFGHLLVLFLIEVLFAFSLENETSTPLPASAFSLFPFQLPDSFFLYMALWRHSWHAVDYLFINCEFDTCYVFNISISPYCFLVFIPLFASQVLTSKSLDLVQKFSCSGKTRNIRNYFWCNA